MSFPLISLHAEEAAPSPPDPPIWIRAPYIPYRPDAPMTFRLAWNGGEDFYKDYWIAAEGIITKDTPQAFLDFLSNDPYKANMEDHYYEGEYFGERPKLPIHIHSCGGDEEAAMKLAEYIHYYGVKISQTFPADIHDPAGPSMTGIGECRGACVLTAMGNPRHVKNPSDPEFGIENEYERLQKIDDGNGHLKGIEGRAYYPIVLGPFQTPFKEILAHIEWIGVDPLWQKKLFPAKHGRSRKLAFWEAPRLGFFQITPDPAKPIPAEESHPCPIPQ